MTSAAIRHSPEVMLQDRPITNGDWLDLGLSLLAVAPELRALSIGGRASSFSSKVLAAESAPKAWSLGDDVYSLTAKGSDPAWSTVRSRFWKNEAANPQYGTWDIDQLAAMKRGNAPQRYNIDKGGMESMDLSHEPIPFRNGGKDVVPRWPQDHANIDPYRRPGY